MADAMSYLASAHSSSGGACRGPQSRAYRRALHRYAKQINALPSCKFNFLKPQEFFSHLGPDAKAFHKNNPQCFGLPRSYSARVVQDDNAQAAPAAAQAIEGKTIVIGQHGSDSSGLQLGSVGVKPSDVNWFSSTNSYVFDTVLEQPSAQLFPQLKASRVSGYVSLEGNAPAASIAIGSDVINVELDKKASWYDVEVAANAGAYLDTHKSTLAWDVKSDKWTNASWEEGKFTWGYDIANRGNDLQEDWVAENMFLDNCMFLLPYYLQVGARPSTELPAQTPIPQLSLTSPWTCTARTTHASSERAPMMVPSSTPPSRIDVLCPLPQPNAVNRPSSLSSQSSGKFR